MLVSAIRTSSSVKFKSLLALSISPGDLATDRRPGSVPKLSEYSILSGRWASDCNSSAIDDREHD